MQRVDNNQHPANDQTLPNPVQAFDDTKLTLWRTDGVIPATKHGFETTVDLFIRR